MRVGFVGFRRDQVCDCKGRRQQLAELRLLSSGSSCGCPANQQAGAGGADSHAHSIWLALFVLLKAYVFLVSLQHVWVLWGSTKIRRATGAEAAVLAGQLQLPVHLLWMLACASMCSQFVAVRLHFLGSTFAQQQFLRLGSH